MLSIGALILLTTLALTIYRTNSSQTSLSYNNEAWITGTALGQSLLEEIETKAFDENTATAPCTSATALTTAAYLGPDAGETSSTNFDDVDDYNNFSRVTGTSRLGNFTVSVKVYYVQPTALGTKSLVQSFIKKVDVNIANDYIVDSSGDRDSLKLNTLIGY
jgi:hypothetical protein